MSQRVDFRLLKSRRTGEARVERRLRFFAFAAKFVEVNAGFDPSDVRSDEGNLYWLTKGYFLPSEAYKQRRNLTDNTQPPKQAALTALAIMTFRPFLPVNDNSVQLPTTVHANQIFAFFCARRQLETDLAALTPKMQDRAYHFLNVQSAHCLTELWTDAKLGIDKPVYDVEIDLDLAAIDGLICIFELLANSAELRRDVVRLEELNRLLEERVRRLLGPLP